MSEHLLYRFWGGDDLLYIGVTLNLSQRVKSHREHALWWHLTDRVTLERHDSRSAVLMAEKAAIIAESPKFNVAHNSTPRNLPESSRQRMSEAGRKSKRSPKFTVDDVRPHRNLSVSKTAKKLGCSTATAMRLHKKLREKEECLA